MKKVILTVGAPGSGKSTWAQEQARKDNGTVILCLDDFRSQLRGGSYKYNKSQETVVKSCHIESLRVLLHNDTVQKIIIADTNLNPNTRELLKKTIQSEDVDVSIVEEVFDVNYPELVNRNKKRGDKSVPSDVLFDMYKKMRTYLGTQKDYTANVSKPNAVIFDIDGTLANNNHRSPYSLDSLIKDTPISVVVESLLMHYKQGYRIILVSGRHQGNSGDPKKHLNSTIEWLKKYDIPYDHLYMRKHNDKRKDDVIKEEIFWNYIADNYNVKAAYDDRDRVVAMWRRIGVPCFQVAFGDF